MKGKICVNTQMMQHDLIKFMGDGYITTVHQGRRKLRTPVL